MKTTKSIKCTADNKQCFNAHNINHILDNKLIKVTICQHYSFITENRIIERIMIHISDTSASSRLTNYFYESVGRLMSNKSLFFSQGFHCNFTVTSADGIRLKCHKAVIAAFGDLSQKYILADRITDEIILPDLSTEEVASLLNFVYSGR